MRTKSLGFVAAIAAFFGPALFVFIGIHDEITEHASAYLRTMFTVCIANLPWRAPRAAARTVVRTQPTRPDRVQVEHASNLARSLS